ncbi:MAG: fibronectin type III domain-containing protein [Spirochaetaceae bacterium]|jgi:hypothetical protein|nr:fibronectin type III domain-containing protein [Spirochaetaceae bacterium]
MWALPSFERRRQARYNAQTMHNARVIALFLVFAAVPSFGLGEETLKFGGAAGWGRFTVRDGLTEVEGLRPYKALALGAVRLGGEPSLDMDVPLDEGATELYIDRTGRYSLQVSESVIAAPDTRTRIGRGAAVFSGNLNAGANGSVGGPVVIDARRHDALFSAGRYIGDFSIEFLLYPVSMENGEEPFEWNASEPQNLGVSQNISCYISKNRFEWDFSNFFFQPSVYVSPAADAKSVNPRLASSSPVVPKNWSHHLLRFDAKTGLLEYLVDGVLEDVTYATESGSEGGEVFLPVAGERGSFTLGKSFNGMMSGFRVWRRFAEHPVIRRYPASGRAQSAPIDLGELGGSVLRIDATGGLYDASAGSGGNRTAFHGVSRFSGGAEMQFFFRSSDSPYVWNDAGWRTFAPGLPMNTENRRYIEIAVQFYPGGDAETTPYLEEISVVFAKNEAPAPPGFVTAMPKNGSVELSWRKSKDENAEGYLVYYGASSGDYSEAQPVDVGKQTSVSIDNLKNGVLYYFSVSSYDKARILGDYSKEVSARPLMVNNE